MYLKFKFRQFGAKIKISSDLIKNDCYSQFEGAEYESDIGILQFFMKNLNFGKLVVKLKSCLIHE